MMSRLLRLNIVVDWSLPKEINHQRTCNLHREPLQKFVDS